MVGDVGLGSRVKKHGGDPLAHLKFETTINLIKEKKKQGTKFFATKMREMFIDNKHNLLSIVTASSEMGEQLGNKTEEQAAELSKDFSDDDRKKYHELTKAMLEEQKKTPSPEVLATLPKLDKSDLPPENEKVPVTLGDINGIPAYSHPLFTAGIVYVDIGFDLI